MPMKTRPEPAPPMRVMICSAARRRPTSRRKVRAPKSKNVCVVHWSCDAGHSSQLERGDYTGHAVSAIAVTASAASSTPETEGAVDTDERAADEREILGSGPLSNAEFVPISGNVKVPLPLVERCESPPP